MKCAEGTDCFHLPTVDVGCHPGVDHLAAGLQVPKGITDSAHGA